MTWSHQNIICLILISLIFVLKCFAKQCYDNVVLTACTLSVCKEKTIFRFALGAGSNHMYDILA